MKRHIEILESGYLDGSGGLLASGTVTSYLAGTSTKQCLFQDFDCTIQHPNPLSLSDEGRVTAYTNTRVKLVFKNSSGATIRTIDDVGTADSDLTASSASDLAGDGLVAPGDGTITVNPDGTTLEISSDAVRVKDGGISTAKLADDSVTVPKSGAILGANLIANLVVTASVGSNALTISFKTESGSDPSATDPISIGFRSTTLTSGAYSHVSATAAITPLVISSGSTLGHTNATEWAIYVYAANNAGTIVPVASSSPLDERLLQSTTAEGGAGAADSVATAYSTSALTSKAVRLVAIFKSTQTTAGTWAVIPTSISAATAPSGLSTLIKRQAHTTVGVGGVAVSASSGNFSSTSASATAVTNLSVTLSTTGRPVKVMLIPDGVNVVSYVACEASMTGNKNLDFLRGSTTLGGCGTPSGSTAPISPAAYQVLDFVAAGTYTYSVKVTSDGTRNYFVNYCILVAYEL